MPKRENQMPLTVTGYDLVNVDGNKGTEPLEQRLQL